MADQIVYGVKKVTGKNLVEFTETLTRVRKENISLKDLRDRKASVENGRDSEIAQRTILDNLILKRNAQIDDLQSKIDAAVALGVTD